jgi:N-methylhydantoinase B
MAINKLEAGKASWTSTHDALPGMAQGGIPITVHIDVRPDAGEIRKDLRDNPDCQPSGLNLSEACARTSAMVGVFNSIDAAVPKNAGSFRLLQIELRENCIAGIACHPTSCSAATTNIADRVANATQCAFATLSAKHGLAECGAIIPAGDGVVSGTDPRTGTPFVNQVILWRVGRGGSARGRRVAVAGARGQRRENVYRQHRAR